MINAPKIILLMGLIGSGKSTYARKLMKYDLFLLRINKDDLRDGFFDKNPWNKEIEAFVSDVSLDVAEIAITAGYSVVVDNTNTTMKQRAHWFDLAEEYDVPIHVVHMTESVNNVKNRMTAPRGIKKTQWESALCRMKKNFQDLSHEEKTKSASIVKMSIS